ncbi:hypothetical protein BB560_003887 [Smittium megazygosporum]|uniref:Uncharacterized protein n=1 Tax=Smittium megazygosporum TaxID=133381 RepID=A0A2T9ZAV1_9FUNG|nr:hypothetical protein BB560_003887 [Smittium megazygosporum]
MPAPPPPPSSPDNTSFMVLKESKKRNRSMLSSEDSTESTAFSKIAKNLSKGQCPTDARKIEDALRNLTGAKSIFSGTTAEIKHGYSRFYIQGIVRQEYKKVKEFLKPLGFQLNKIANLNFIGKKTLEFTINSDYASAFVRKVNELKVLKLIPKVDPSVPLDYTASEDSKQVVKTAFTNQLRRSYLSTSIKNMLDTSEI